MSPPQHIENIKSAAVALGVPRSTLNRWIIEGSVPALRSETGRVIGIDLEAAREAIARKKLKGLKMESEIASPQSASAFSAQNAVLMLANLQAELMALKDKVALRSSVEVLEVRLSRVEEENSILRKTLGLLANEQGLSFRVYEDEEGARTVELIDLEPAKKTPAEQDAGDKNPASKNDADIIKPSARKSPKKRIAFL